MEGRIFRYRSQEPRTFKPLVISTSRHPLTRTTYSVRPQPSTTAPQSTCNKVLSLTAFAMEGPARLQSTRPQAKSLHRFSSRFKCRGSIRKCDQPKEISSIQSSRMVKRLLPIANCKAVLRPSRRTLCRLSLNCSRTVKASNALSHEPMNHLVTASSPSILQENRMPRIRLFHRQGAEHLISDALIRQLMWAPPWSILI